MCAIPFQAEKKQSISRKEENPAVEYSPLIESPESRSLSSYDPCGLESNKEWSLRHDIRRLLLRKLLFSYDTSEGPLNVTIPIWLAVGPERVLVVVKEAPKPSKVPHMAPLKDQFLWLSLAASSAQNITRYEPAGIQQA